MASKTMPPAKVDTSDPAVRRLVYNMYRGMLGGYNDQANDIVDALPAERVREDQGIHRQLESMIRQSSHSSGGASPGAGAGPGGCAGDASPAPAPPPPPPPAPGGFIPSMRINTEIPDGRGRSPKPCAPGEPPAAIQNAMMTKDKKPFTYTPGGLDLSQIRSPRIQRRINRNINDEGVGAQPQQERPPPQLTPAAQAAMQPNMQVQVLPAVPPPPPPPPPGQHPHTYSSTPSHPPAPSYAPPLGGAQAPVSAQAVQLTAANLRPTGIAPMRRDQQLNEPGSLYVAPVPATPTPAAPRAQLGSLYIPPVDAVDSASASPSSATPPPPPQRYYSPQSPQAGLNKAPTPWMSTLQQQQHQQQQPAWQQQQPPSPPQQQQQQPQPPSPPQQQQQQGGSRIIPIQIEGREQTPAQPQQQDSNLAMWQQRQQQRQQQVFPPNPQVPWRTVQAPASPAPSSQPPGERVIPIQIEGASGASSPPAPAGPAAGGPRQFQQQRQPQLQQQHNSPEWGAGPPVQSQSFRVLQKITGTDRNDDDVDVPRNQQPGRQNDLNAVQLRKLQLSEDDRALMNKFKTQVDEEVYLHQESDPRYRGAAIPSRAFRMLQNMTGADDGMAPMPSRISPAVRAVQQSMQDSAAQPYVPPSEQTAPEPRKYTGGAIPSRSFRMLQAMTAGSAMNPSTNGRETPLSVSLQPEYDAYGAEYNPSRDSSSMPDPDTSSNPSGYWVPQTPEQQQQFWEHYNAMCAYMAEMNAALGLGPVPYPTGYHYPYDPYWGYHASDSEDCSGYSSTDEMSYYGANFARTGNEYYPRDPYSRHYAQQRHVVTPRITVTPTTDPETPTNEFQSSQTEESKNDVASSNKGINEKRVLTDVLEEDSVEDEDEDDSTETDTEKEDFDVRRRHSGSGNSLQTIRSVPNVHVYSDSGDAMDSMTSETDEQTEDDYDGEDDVIVPSLYAEEQSYPHQLSVILEESEISDAESVRKICQKADSLVVAESSTATTNSECDSEDDIGDVESTVMVRLPLRLKFSRSENDEEVTTVIVGDSQVRRTSLSSVESPEHESSTHPLAVSDDNSCAEDVSITVTIPTRSASVPDQKEGRRVSISKEFCLEDSMGSGEGSVKVENDNADVSISVPIFQKRKTSSSIASPVENLSNTSEEEDRAKSTEESDFHWEDDSSSTSIQTVRGASEKSNADHNSGSEVEAAGTADELEDSITLKKDPEDIEDVEDFEWGEDGTLRTVRVPKQCIQTAHSLDSEGYSEGNYSANVSEHSEELSEDDELSSASSSDSSSSSSSRPGRKSSNSSNSSGSSSVSGENSAVSNKSTSPSRQSPAVKSEVVALSQASSIIEAESESDAQKPEKPDDTSSSAEEDSEDEGEDLESDSKPEEVEKYVRNIISNMKFMSPNTSDDRSTGGERMTEGQLNTIKSEPLDIHENNSNDKPDLSKGESEEDDSGVTSDMSRHISEAENEENSESHKPRKISKYQRAQTHSRLFRLLQDESLSSQANGQPTNESHEPGLEQHYNIPVGGLSGRKECLTLPLASNTISDPDSLSSSSGITSPSSPTITDRLVKELVHTLLHRKKGRRLRKIPIAKVQAAALRILQEDMDPYDTLSSTSEEGSGQFLRSSAECSFSGTNNTTDPDKSDSNVYGSNYQDYRNYYESWNTSYDDTGAEYDIMPSRAFKLLDQHAQPDGFSSGIIEGLWAKCPRVRSSKNVTKDAPQNPDSISSQDPCSNSLTSKPDDTCTVASGREDK